MEVLIFINISILYLRYVGFDLRNVNGFGDDKDSPEDELKEAPTHSRNIENLFGIEDSIVTGFEATTCCQILKCLLQESKESC